MKQTLVIGASALLIGGALGFAIGKAGGDAEDSRASVETPREAKLGRPGEVTSASRVASRSRATTTEDALGEAGQMARLQSLIDMYAGMDAGQLEQEAGNLDRLPMGDRILASVLLFSRWAEIDPQGALAFTNTMGFGGNFAKPTVLRGWASVDPVNAAKYFGENPREFAMMDGRGPGGDAGADTIAREWAKQDPNSAMEWARGLEGRDRDSAMVSVIGEMALKDPAEAAALAATLDGDAAGRAYSEVAKAWATKDYDAAQSWIQSLSGEAREDAMGAAIGTLAKNDPIRASRELERMNAGGEKDRAIRDVAEAWSRDDPQAAATWTLAQQTEDIGDPMRRVMGNWANVDSVGALSFIEDLEVGVARDSAAQAYLWTNRAAEPQQSLALAETISDDRDRTRAIGMTAARWMREDQTAARSYIEQSQFLDDEAKQRILEGGGRFGRRGR